MSAPDRHRLGNGRYAVLVTAAGTGCSTFEGYALTRWRADPTEDGEGFFVYLRDLASGAVWSVGRQPAPGRPRRYAARRRPGRVEIARLDHGIEARLEVCVDPEADAELRRVRLRNRSARRRRIELTSYAELVLHHPDADAAHPAFSKLFVQTEAVLVERALLARRRPRSPEEPSLWLAHALAGGETNGPFEYETDRARFIGRGASLADPLALRATALLSGTAGSVLDPVVSLRRAIGLDPGAGAVFTFVLGAGRGREAVLGLVRRYRQPGAVAAAFRRAARVERDRPAEPGDAVGIAMGAPSSFPASSRFRPVEGAAGDERLADKGEALRLWNGYGGFSADGGEYVIRLQPDGTSGLHWPPMPWANVIANETFGCIATESGAGYTWGRNSREHRLTPWYNDPVTDPHGEALYLRDEQAGVFWSATPGPVPQAVAREVRHGLGYTRYRHRSQGLEQDLWVFVSRAEPVKIAWLRLTNPSGRARRLSVFNYQRLVMAGLPAQSSESIVTEFDREAQALLARNPANGAFADGVAFAAAVAPAEAGSCHFTADRAAFIGRGGSPASPEALREADVLDGRAGARLDPCFALQLALALAPGETIECAFLLGETMDAAAARALIARYRWPGAISQALEAVRAFWRETVSAVRIETPAPAIDLMLNGWLVYQNLSCRLWGRSAYFQSGGAFGFRDQLQDAAALVYARPGLTRAQILLHAAHQFVEGDVLHWWHPPPMGRGIRTRFSDDLLWLPYVTAFYIGATGERGILDERVRFIAARPLANGEDEAYLLPEDSGQSEDLYEHCCRALDRSLTRGAHGLPLMGTGDWNDGMNRVGREGRGESVWLGFFLYAILNDFVPLCEHRGDGERAERYRAYREHLAVALNDGGWDGAWYRRAYYDDGTPLGSAASDECRIDALAQAWAVISGAASPERAAAAMDAVEQHLIAEGDGIIRLLAPPFDATPHDPGYIKGYVPGIRENGGQYTHAALWVVQAAAMLGRRERAARLLEMLSPVSHARTAEAVAVYRVEPYVIAADVYGVPPHVGRGGWTWYTGSAGWMYRVALESVLGFRLWEGHTLLLKPCIPDAWPGFRLRYRRPDGRTAYEIEVNNPTGCAQSVVAAAVDGEPANVEAGAACIPLLDDGAEHRVCVTLS